MVKLPSPALRPAIAPNLVRGGTVELSKRWSLLSFPTFLSLLSACGSGPVAAPEDTATSTEGLSLTGSALLPLDCLSLGDNWPSFGSDVCNSRATLTDLSLNPRSASRLAVKWTFKAAGDVSATPAVVGNELYVPDWGGMLNKLDARTGKVIWSVSIGTLLGIAGTVTGTGPSDTPATVAARDTPIVTPDSVIFGVVGGRALGGPTGLGIVAAVDRQTGALRWQTQVDPHIATVMTSSPVYNNGKVYIGVSSGEEIFAALPLLAGVPYTCCTFRGSVVALDAETGKIDWKTYMIEDSAYFQSDGKTPSGFAGAAVWSTPTIDRKRGSVYVTTGNNYSTPPGTTSLPSGDHVESIVALDMQTGAFKWSQRMTMGDVYTIVNLLEGDNGGPDYDFGASANLFHAKVHGVDHDVVGAGQKSGMYWAVDADTGNSLWSTAVGPGGHLGGIHWGTAVDAQRIYVGVNDQAGSSYALGGDGPQAGQLTTVGSWAALNPATGSIEWQVADPAMTAPLQGVSVNGPVSVANGILFGGSMDANGTMFAFDAATGAVLWSFQSGGSVYGGPAIADGVVYWGNGLPNASRLLFGTPGGTLYAFAVPTAH
jgi:polyvinyl alcohol dehydrogenase (cytochrome)